MRYFAIDLSSYPMCNISGKSIHLTNHIHCKRFLADNELFLVVKGTLHIQQQENMQVREGEILFHTKDQYQFGTKASQHVFFWLHFTAETKSFDKIEDAIEFCNQNPTWLFMPEHFKLNQIEILETLWAQLNHRFVYNDSANKLFRNNILGAILSEASFQNNVQLINHDFPSRLLEIIQYINMHITEKISLIDLSNIFSYNSKYLSSLFRKYTKKTITTYITETRITMAINYLINSNEPIKSIASKIGFEDEYYFMRIFKKIIGTTPKQYRNSYGKGFQFSK